MRATIQAQNHRMIMKKVALLIALLSLRLAAQESFTFDSPEFPADHVRYFGCVYEPKERAARSDVESYIIQGVPPLIWKHGCAPTSVGMLMGYYERFGYPNLIADTNDIYQSVSSHEHYQDYSYPEDTPEQIIPDRSELGGAHPNNCVADFLGTSFSRLRMSYGGTRSDYITSGTLQYMSSRYPGIDIGRLEDRIDATNFAHLYETLKAHIQANHPVLLAVDSDGVDGIDHAVIMVGYTHDKATQIREYIAYNTWDNQLHTYPFVPADYSNTPFSVQYYYILFPEYIIPKTPVYRFYRTDAGSYFFTASEAEKDSLISVPQFEFSGISHFVYVGTGSPGVVPVYRFLNRFGSHFYTASEQERDAIVQNLSNIYQLEGIAFFVLAGKIGSAKPVYRFFQPSTASHYFTIHEDDKEYRIAYDDTMLYEGIAWYAFPD